MGAGLFEYYATTEEFYSLKKLTQPIRCIHGDLYPTQIEKNRAIYPNFDAITIPHTGHYPMLENRELFNQHLEEILKTMIKNRCIARVGESWRHRHIVDFILQQPRVFFEKSPPENKRKIPETQTNSFSKFSFCGKIMPCIRNRTDYH